jgi:hypothetical protein
VREALPQRGGRTLWIERKPAQQQGAYARQPVWAFNDRTAQQMPPRRRGVPEPRRLNDLDGMGNTQSDKCEFFSRLRPEIAIGSQELPTSEERNDVRRGDRLTDTDDNCPTIAPRVLRPLLKKLCAVNRDRGIEKSFHMHLGLMRLTMTEIISLTPGPAPAKHTGPLSQAGPWAGALGRVRRPEVFPRSQNLHPMHEHFPVNAFEPNVAALP